MGWFGAGYPQKPQWNGIWWVVCVRLGQEKKGGAGPQFRQKWVVESCVFWGLQLFRQCARFTLINKSAMALGWLFVAE
jgi:hypothetical protein